MYDTHCDVVAADLCLAIPHKSPSAQMIMLRFMLVSLNAKKNNWQYHQQLGID